MSIHCGIVAGPNSYLLIEKLINICEKLSFYKINWLLMVDKIKKINIKKSNKILMNENDFSNLQNRKNIKIDYFDTEIKCSGGDRHGYGIDLIIRKLNKNNKIIILEPDSFPCHYYWDKILLKKLDKEHPIVVMSKEGVIDKNYKRIINKNHYIRSKYCGDIGLLAITTKFFVNNNLTFMKHNNILNCKVNKNLEELFYNKPNIIIDNKNIAEIFDVNIGDKLQKEFGWRIAYEMNIQNKNSKKLKFFIYNPKNNHHSIDVIFYKDKIFAIHLHFSRYITSELLNNYKKNIFDLLQHYNKDENILNIFNNYF